MAAQMANQPDKQHLDYDVLAQKGKEATAAIGDSTEQQYLVLGMLFLSDLQSTLNVGVLHSVMDEFSTPVVNRLGVDEWKSNKEFVNKKFIQNRSGITQKMKDEVDKELALRQKVLLDRASCSLATDSQAPC